ncbi:hypothetical protein [Thermodesulfovibrio hydrogeniphilus]
MFVKESWSTKKGKKYKTYEISKAYRDKKTKKVRHEKIANITHLGEPLISKIRQLLKSPEKKVVVDKDKFFEDATSVGHILLLLGFMMKIGFLGWLRHFPKKVRDLLLAVVLNRIIEPRSKYASVGWIRRSGFMELFDLEGRGYACK